MSKIYPATVFFFVLLASSIAEAKVINVPAITAKEAIELVEKYVQANNIELTKFFLAKVEYLNLHNEYKDPYWRIEYRMLAGATSGLLFSLLARMDP